MSEFKSDLIYFQNIDFFKNNLLQFPSIIFLFTTKINM